MTSTEALLKQTMRNSRFPPNYRNSFTHALGMYSEGWITGCPARDVSLDCTPIGAGLCASTFDEKMPQTSEVVCDYTMTSLLVHQSGKINLR